MVGGAVLHPGGLLGPSAHAATRRRRDRRNPRLRPAVPPAGPPRARRDAGERDRHVPGPYAPGLRRRRSGPPSLRVALLAVAHAAPAHVVSLRAFRGGRALRVGRRQSAALRLRAAGDGLDRRMRIAPPSPRGGPSRRAPLLGAARLLGGDDSHAGVLLLPSVFAVVGAGRGLGGAPPRPTASADGAHPAHHRVRGPVHLVLAHLRWTARAGGHVRAVHVARALAIGRLTLRHET